MADAADSKSASCYGNGGSSPPLGTKKSPAEMRGFLFLKHAWEFQEMSRLAGGVARGKLAEHLGLVSQMHGVALSRGAVDAVPTQDVDAPRAEETGVGHGPG